MIVGEHSRELGIFINTWLILHLCICVKKNDVFSFQTRSRNQSDESETIDQRSLVSLFLKKYKYLFFKIYIFENNFCRVYVFSVAKDETVKKNQKKSIKIKIDIVLLLLLFFFFADTHGAIQGSLDAACCHVARTSDRVDSVIVNTFLVSL